MPELLMQVFVLACVGVALEVVFTAVSEFPESKNLRLQGYTYVWMFPIYGMIPLFLGYLYPRLAAWPLLGRLAFYVAILLACEYVTGWLLRRLTGECPWERNYKHSKWAVGNGLMRFDYAPAWGLACFIFESVYRYVARV